MKQFAIFWLLLLSIDGYSQFGFSIEANKVSFNKDVLSHKPQIGYGFGVISKLYLHSSGDLLAEFTYTTNNTKLDGYNRNDFSETNFINYKIENLNFSLVYSFNLISDDNDFYYGFQAGTQLNLINNWVEDGLTEYSFEPFGFTRIDFQAQKPTNLGYLLGVWTHYKLLRINFRYYQTITNPLRGFIAITDNGPIEPKLKTNSFSISLNFFLN